MKRGRKFFGKGLIHHRGFGPVNAIAFQDGGGGDGDGDGGGGGGGGGIDLSDPKIVEAINTAVGAATVGLQGKNSELIGTQKDLKAELETLKTTWSGMDPDSVKALLSKFETDEETKLIAEGKFDEVMAARTQAMTKDWETRISASATKIDELQGLLNERNTVIHTLKVGHSIRAAALESGISIPGAVEDAVALAGHVFHIDDSGDLEPRDGSGALLLGPDGKNRLQPSEWLAARKEDKPHWWGESSGGGSGGGGGNDDRNPDNLEGMSSRNKLVHGMTGGS